MQELLTREERDRLAERLLPGEKILWQGKSRCGWWRRAAKEWKGMLFSVFFAAAWGWGCCIAASAPVWTGEVMFVLAVTGICCFFGIALLGMLLINAVLETRRANAVLHALTNMRLLSLGPSADGNGVLFRQWNGAELRKIRLVAHRAGPEDLYSATGSRQTENRSRKAGPRFPERKRSVSKSRASFPACPYHGCHELRQTVGRFP